MSTDTAVKQNAFTRFALFLRQVMAELKKVVWPTREQLITYTTVVVVFVTVLALVVATMDFGFTKAVLKIFG
jgi:preprotein translocase subunit SecE